MNKISTFLIFLSISLISSCGGESNTGSTVYIITQPKVHFANVKLQSEFKNELAASGIEFWTESDEENREYVVWNKDDDEVAKAAKERAIGEPPPNGRSIGVSPKSELNRIASDLEKAGIPLHFQKYYGEEYIVWEEEYSEEVESLQGGFYTMFIYRH